MPAGRRLVMWLLVACAGLLLVVPLPARWVERVYSSGVYPLWQQTLTPISNGVPFALLDGLLVAALLGTVAIMRRTMRGPRSAAVRVVSLVGVVLVVAALVYVWFALSWGLNYQRQPLSMRLDFDRRRITPDALERLAWRTVEELNRLHGPAWKNPWPTLEELPPRLAAPLAQTTTTLGLSPGGAPGRPKVTILQPYFRRAGIDGMTDPFFLEVLINSDALPVERHFIVAHEWGHLAGLAHEAEASYFGWRLCLAGDDQAAYSGWLFLYGHAAAVVPPHIRQALQTRLDSGAQRDLSDVAARARRASPVVSAAAWRVYDSYLKTQRVPEGVASYDAVLQLVLGTAESPSKLQN